MSVQFGQLDKNDHHLLRIHPSFWAGEIVQYLAPRLNARRVRTERSFMHWQALRRNKQYASWAFKTFIENKEFFEGKSFFDKYFTSYAPTAQQTFSGWRWRVMNKTSRGRIKTAEEIEWEILAKKVVWESLPKGSGLPDRWLPIPAWIEFPHPDVLTLLTPGLCVSPVPLPETTAIKIRHRKLWIDLSCSLQEIVRDILSYDDFLGMETNKDKTEVRREAKIQLGEAFRRRPRSTTPMRKRTRKREKEPPRLARSFVAWDMKRDGASYSDIAKAFWPKEYDESRGQLRRDGNRQALLQRAKDHVKDAERRIMRWNQAFRP